MASKQAGDLPIKEVTRPLPASGPCLARLGVEELTGQGHGLEPMRLQDFDRSLFKDADREVSERSDVELQARRRGQFHLKGGGYPFEKAEDLRWLGRPLELVELGLEIMQQFQRFGYGLGINRFLGEPNRTDQARC